MFTTTSAKPNMILSHLMLFTANFIWGTSFIFTKMLLSHLPPVTIAVIRFSLAGLFLLGIILFIFKEKIADIKQDLWALCALGFTGITIYYYTENTSLVTISASSASLILALIPAFTLLLSILFLREKARLISITGVIIAFWGATLVIFKDSELFEISKLDIGYLHAVIAALAFSLYTIISKVLMLRRSPVQTTMLTFIFGSTFLIPFIYLEAEQLATVNYSHSILINISYLTICCSIIAYFSWNWGLKRIDAGKASVYLNIIPLTTVILGSLILKEELNSRIITGGGLILFGIFLTNLKRFRALPKYRL